MRGIERMVDEDRYCIDILTQIAAVNTALESLALKILDDHVSHCVAGALASGDAADAGDEDRGAARSRPALRRTLRRGAMHRQPGRSPPERGPVSSGHWRQNVRSGEGGSGGR